MLPWFRFILLVVLFSINTVSAETIEQGDRLKVVVSFSILADMAHVVGGEYVDIYSLVGPEEDVHVYQPRPKDAQRLAQADLLILNGLGFEGWIERLIVASGYQGPIVRASDKVPRLISANHDHGDGDDINAYNDPHAWQSVSNAKVYVDNITNGLVLVDAMHHQYYYARRDSYQLELDALDQYIKTQISKIPGDRRKLLTSHRAYTYFESTYDIEFVAAQGINTSADVSARDIARLIRLVKAENITAAFFENSSNPRLLRQISSETGCRIVGNLYADSLSKNGGPASTYIKMMRYNLESLLKALSTS